MNKRPISPHLSIYKWQITSVLSILHRLTGVVLFFSFVIIAIGFSYLSFITTSGNNAVINFVNSIPFFLNSCLCLAIPLYVIILGFVFSFSYHFFNGLRYLFWTFGKAMGLSDVTKTAYLVLILSFVTTIFIFYKLLTWI